MNIELSWADFKAKPLNKAQIRFVEQTEFYTIWYTDSQGRFSTSILKDAGADQVEFEADYKSLANALVDEPLDSDNSRISRTKITKTGWRYDPRSLDWVTGKFASLYNKKPTGFSVSTQTDIGDAIMRFWKADETELLRSNYGTDELFQADLDAYCTATAVEWQATYDMDVIGATIMVRAAPTTDAYFWAIVAPSIPEIYGGRKTFGNGGFNFRHMNDKDQLEINGRGVKLIAYDPVYYTNKFQFFTCHEVGVQIGIQLFFEHFRG